MCFNDIIHQARSYYIINVVIHQDQTQCLKRLFSYPPIETPVTLIKMALNCKQIINNRLSNKNTNNKSETNKKMITKKKSKEENKDLHESKRKESQFPFRKDYIEIQFMKYNNDTIKEDKSNDKFKNIPEEEMKQFAECFKTLEKFFNKYGSILEKEDEDSIKLVIEFLKDK